MIKEVSEKEFDSEVLSEEKMLVVGSATWCRPCKNMIPILEKFEEESKVKVIKFDIDDSPELSKKFSVKSVPCIMRFENGKVVATKGSMTIDQLKEFML